MQLKQLDDGIGHTLFTDRPSMDRLAL